MPFSNRKPAPALMALNKKYTKKINLLNEKII